MNGKEKVRLLAGKLAAMGTRQDKGDFGETRAQQWFKSQGLDYFFWPQAREAMPRSLAHKGGKRPDFVVDFGAEIVYIDAKYHVTSNLSEFSIEDTELQKLCVFRDWIREEYGDEGERDVVFMVYPLESSGQRFVLIHLDEMLSGWPTTVRGSPGHAISLIGRDETWFDQRQSGSSEIP